MAETVYINFDQNKEVNKTPITIGDVAKVWCEDNTITGKVKTIVLADAKDAKSRRFVFNIIDVVKKIIIQCPGINVNNMGETDFVVSYKSNPKNNVFFQWIKIIIVSVIVFFGGSFAIMAYGNDVDINSVFDQVCSYAGKEDMTPYVKISYSMGLAVGIIVFYNHLGKRKYKKDPTPLEVEMRLYEQDINTAIIKNGSREGKV